MAVMVRRLGAEDVAAYRELRLAALRLHPDAFGASLDEEAALDHAGHAARLSPVPPGVVLGAFEDAALVGMAGIAGCTAARLRHKALLWGVHVRPASRRRGIGRVLLAAVESHARASGIELVQLGVNITNHAARALYAACGYRVYREEHGALRLGPGRYVDEELRVLDLRTGG